MPGNVSRPSGEEWQNWANKLLVCRYGPTEYQKVPDNDRGDAGLEGFTLTDGHAYQAYGCEEPLSTADRYVKQRDKMTRDIGKFINNRMVLERLLGTVRVSRWALFVPYFDSKELRAHASQKTAEVINRQLPYVATTFHVAVCEEDDFPVERDQLLRAGARTLLVEPNEATAEHVTDWATANDALTATLDGKLRKLPTIPTEAARKSFQDRVLKWFLEGQTILESLRGYPEVYEKVVKTISHRENFLATAAIVGGTPQDILSGALSGLLDSLKSEVRELHAFSAESLAYQAVADWLLRCPLDFPDLVPNA